MTLNCLNRAGSSANSALRRRARARRRAGRSVSPTPLVSPGSPWPFSSSPLAVKRDAAASGLDSYAAPPTIARHSPDARRRAASGRGGTVDFRRRPHRRRRAQRIGQIDPVSHRRGRDQCRPAEPASSSLRRASPICRRSRTCPASRPRSTMCSPGLSEFDDPYAARAHDGRARGRSGRRSQPSFRRRSAPRGAGQRS